ncbi:hypothetical protein SSS_05112 [Sarcoptes scabiei]|nr:hypothetical protein SSS_05112 [Sarcoptes scabiei]
MFICSTDYEAKCKEMQRILYQLPTVTQHLLVLLFGTFFSIVNSRSTGMSSESLSISVAPSFFHTCIPDGNKFAKIEDVQRFKIASSIIKFMIDNFGVCNLFGKENYEYYARITRRVLNVEESWTFAFKYPSEELVPAKTCLSLEKEWVKTESRKWNLPDFHLNDHSKGSTSKSLGLNPT